MWLKILAALFTCIGGILSIWNPFNRQEKLDGNKRVRIGIIITSFGIAVVLVLVDVYSNTNNSPPVSPTVIRDSIPVILHDTVKQKAPVVKAPKKEPKVVIRTFGNMVNPVLEMFRTPNVQRKDSILIHTYFYNCGEADANSIHIRHFGLFEIGNNVFAQCHGASDFGRNYELPPTCEQNSVREDWSIPLNMFGHLPFYLVIVYCYSDEHGQVYGPKSTIFRWVTPDLERPGTLLNDSDYNRIIAELKSEKLWLDKPF